MSEKVSRRAFVRTSALTAMGIGFAACAPAAVPTAPPAATQPAAAAKAPPAAPTPTAPPAAPAPTAAAAVAAQPVVDMTIAHFENPAQPIRQESPSRLAAAAANGLKITMVTTPQAEFGAKFKLWVATKQVPDLFNANFSQLVDAGPEPSVIQPILPLIDKYGDNLKRYVAAYPETVKRWAIGGVQYMVPAYFYNWKLAGPMPVIRTDLLEKSKVAVPQDFDQLYEALKALMKDNPGSIGWTGRFGIKQVVGTLAYPLGSGHGQPRVGFGNPYFDEAVNGGTWLYGAIQPEFKDVLVYLAKLYNEGIIDPDISSSTQDQWAQKNSSKGLFTYENTGYVVGWNNALQGTNPQATMAAIPTLKGKRGARQFDYSAFSQGYGISANYKNPERAIQLMDWLLSPIGLDTSSWGIEGKDYTLKGTRPSRIDDYSPAGITKVMDPAARELLPAIKDKYAKSAQPYFAFQSDIGAGLADLTIQTDFTVTTAWDPPQMGSLYQVMAADPGLRKETIAPAFTADENAKIKQYKANIDTILDPAIEKVVLGQLTLSDYDKAVQNAIKAGAQDVEKIYQDAEARMKG
jgi:putative aldouronate transport system substrate-binding protein